jgi:hypothetical protein
VVAVVCHEAHATAPHHLLCQDVKLHPLHGGGVGPPTLHFMLALVLASCEIVPSRPVNSLVS